MKRQADPAWPASGAAAQRCKAAPPPELANYCHGGDTAHRDCQPLECSSACAQGLSCAANEVTATVAFASLVSWLEASAPATSLLATLQQQHNVHHHQAAQQPAATALHCHGASSHSPDSFCTQPTVSSLDSGAALSSVDQHPALNPGAAGGPCAMDSAGSDDCMSGWFSKCRGCYQLTAAEQQLNGVCVPLCRACHKALQKREAADRERLVSRLLRNHAVL